MRICFQYDGGRLDRVWLQDLKSKLGRITCLLCILILLGLVGFQYQYFIPLRLLKCFVQQFSKLLNIQNRLETL